jgi:predicted flap endonuclease-1-like 5' DNA nuclease
MAEPTIEELAENVNNPNFGDDRLGVMFYTRTIEDKERTLAEGRKCFRDREYIKIMVPGDRLNIIDRPVQRTGMQATDDTLRFAKQYARFKNAQEQVAHDGMPLSLWPGIGNSLVEELKYMNIFTVEQLATLADTHVAKIPRGHEFKRKAAEFVEALKDQAQVNKLQAELSERDNRIEALEKSVADQAARIEALLKKLK